MSNKLTPVIIDNACRKGWQYRARDSVMALITLALWLMVLSRLHAFYAVEDAILAQLLNSAMLQLLVAGFVVTFLTFHAWAIYNRYLYLSLERDRTQTVVPLLEQQESWGAPLHGVRLDERVEKARR
ncbi:MULTISPECIES: hypothetical protein [unclassified Halomonas]|uniref:hypothetical protein n=1 Tax=unclassified Halomonas TaxID=2609666 RepID=UPI0020A21A08|nr:MULTISPECIES: hypothetical protein [unclassified Halomonas]MCP1314359.1 hypothetical protein [Halomonas sp. 707D7]MCP1326150.1 hypothetical protein [Halomonas sp. 707D4]